MIEVNTYHLVSQHKNRLQAELALTEAEEVLETGSQQVDDHDVVVALDAEPSHVGNAGCWGWGDGSSASRIQP